ncbi:MAG TPA: hypothetical protein VFQ53_08710 [Kofleriaceae bacterium]|nr:hypothetical protein [Kofleriaceae bacterium]
MRGLVIAIVLAGCGPAKLALLPMGTQQSPRDPDLTRPLVETPASSPHSEHQATRAPAASGPAVDAGVSAAAIASWLLGGAAPLVGIYGTFDENRMFEHATRPAPPPTEQ